MTLEHSPEAQNWLSQFEIVDREVARQLLRQLTLVSESDFERNIQSAIEGVVNSLSHENFALLSVTEVPSKFASSERRVAGSSADRVKHILENISRVHGVRVQPNPTLKSMREVRVRNIVLVDDFVGSGKRIKSFWKDLISGSIKSWASYKWTKIWLVCYAGLGKGLAEVARRLPIPKSRIITVFSEMEKRLTITPSMSALAEKYGRALRGESWAGFSGGRASIVFQHGCPNNTPAILWANGKGFRAIFPNRGIPPNLQVHFGSLNVSATAEVLWTFRQYKLAISLLADARLSKLNAIQLRLIVALGLASSHGSWDDRKLTAQLMLTSSEVIALRSLAYRLHAIDKQDHRLTAFARDLLSGRKSQPSVAEPAQTKLATLEELYYPVSCGGGARR